MAHLSSTAILRITRVKMDSEQMHGNALCNACFHAFRFPAIKALQRFEFTGKGFYPLSGGIPLSPLHYAIVRWGQNGF